MLFNPVFCLYGSIWYDEFKLVCVRWWFANVLHFRFISLNNNPISKCAYGVI